MNYTNKTQTQTIDHSNNSFLTQSAYSEGFAGNKPATPKSLADEHPDIVAIGFDRIEKASPRSKLLAIYKDNLNDSDLAGLTAAGYAINSTICRGIKTLGFTVEKV